MLNADLFESLLYKIYHSRQAKGLYLQSCDLECLVGPRWLQNMGIAM